ncbi:hypothetical protein B0H17DRAFT_846229, partial [Mycena rosella]
SKPLQSTGRPEAVAWWTGHSRKRKPTLTNVEKFDMQWNIWWGQLNPSWRREVDGEMAREEHGGWGALKASGINGLFTVMVCLKWWKEELGDSAAVGDWVHAVADVTWV